MSARLRAIARETERIVAEGRYTAPGGRVVDIADAVAAARAGTRLYGPGPVAVPGEGTTGAATVFEVTGEDSLAAARRLAADRAAGEVAVLNFASARNPGGGYLNGAQAQEEAVCRGSALYACLREVPGFYAEHRADPSPFYSDRVAHSPGVPVFRDDRSALLESPFRAGFLTSAAPNAGVIERRTPERAGRIPAALVARAGRVLEVAAAHGYGQLVLGAWGCGVFRNEPAHVAAAFAAHLTGRGRFAGHFGRVVFAVLDRRSDSPTRAAFSAVFGGRG
ncbi:MULTISPECIES: TIGR02452 family protein [Streptomyces]|uniref:TIGR02452 family protein n=1 Tax=Streptomyces TaxID=1883 RepID=UPI00163D16A0|nr:MULTISPECIES: TIGR02452 family protein [Streptomyces]MBC2876423.1 TIGR02452 family protein [Streptomyces sp. TYQ1024]UBI35365.1 TIGR02452 family protein [Streptomyces mobaraensis]UKW27956.1 TIGR02452 family protein [Streptomyces sp. TYQ1024]